MITIKNKLAIHKMEEAGKLLSEIFGSLGPLIIAGISTLEIDSYIAKKLQSCGLVSKSKGYMGYQHVSCISLNDVVVHGIPSHDIILRDGDLVKVDVCASYSGYCADMARCFFIGKPSSEVQLFIEVVQKALLDGVEQACVGNHISDISAAIQQTVESHGFGIVREFAGHGIGKQMHEDPEIVNYGSPGKGSLLRSGMTIAIEPMITMGNHELFIANDGWTAKTVDKSLAAHVEDTILITTSGPKILTRPAGIDCS